VARVVEEVDHIVTLPRLSSHVIAGYSHGHKCAVGWLRDDSRYLLHFDGASIHEKYTELNYAAELASRHRLTLTLAEKVLLFAGPDEGPVVEATPWVILASDNMANHDAVAVAALSYLEKASGREPPGAFAYGEQADAFNQVLLNVLIPNKYGAPWGDRDEADYTPVAWHDYQAGIEQDRGLVRAYELLGGAPEAIQVRTMGLEPAVEFTQYLAAWSGGVLKMSRG